MDIYYPSDKQHISKTFPVIVWIHGGGWVSGSKKQVGNYAKMAIPCL
ncbi:MAG: carboxylesterase family protein [Bacteroidota bacterium]